MVGTTLIGGQPAWALIRTLNHLEFPDSGEDSCYCRLDATTRHVAHAARKALYVIRVEIVPSGRAEFPGDLGFEALYTMTRRLFEAMGREWAHAASDIRAAQRVYYVYGKNQPVHR